MRDGHPHARSAPDHADRSGPALAVIDRVSALAAAMRAAGSTVGVGEVLRAHRALASVDAARKLDAYCALRATLCASRADLERFDAAWAITFVGDEVDLAQPDALRELGRLVAPRVSIPEGRRLQPVPAEEPVPVPAAWSAEELLLGKDFADYTDADRAAARALLARLAHRGPVRRSRRLGPPVRRRGPALDARATLRSALRHGGDAIRPYYRHHTARPRRMVLCVDVSGSMSPYARMLLQYAQACVTARARVEAFAFGTRLTRITHELRGRDAEAALRRATTAVVDLGGGTRIGAALAALNREHGRRIGRGAVCVVLSDGWDRGDPQELACELARLRRCAHRVVWLNPLAADPRYAPLTRGMQAAMPHTDHLLPGNSLASLEALAELMESLDR